jgi:hypothetical protein
MVRVALASISKVELAKDNRGGVLVIETSLPLNCADCGRKAAYVEALRRAREAKERQPPSHLATACQGGQRNALCSRTAARDEDAACL